MLKSIVVFSPQLGNLMIEVSFVINISAIPFDKARIGILNKTLKYMSQHFESKGKSIRPTELSPDKIIN
jgi:hypothetical protein